MNRTSPPGTKDSNKNRKVKSIRFIEMSVIKDENLIEGTAGRGGVMSSDYKDNSQKDHDRIFDSLTGGGGGGNSGGAPLSMLR